MDLYHIWFDIKDTRRDLEFADALETYMNHLRDRDLIHGWRLTRRKLGFSPPHLFEFHVMIEVKNLDQLEQAFQTAATREPGIEKLHAAVYARVRRAQFALYRDFPDPNRERKRRAAGGLGFTARKQAEDFDDELAIEPIDSEAETETEIGED